MRGASHQHNGLDHKGKRRRVRLRHIRDAPRALTSGKARRRTVAESHLAAVGRQQTEQRLEQSGLTAAVGAQQRQHLARFQRNVEVASDHAIAITESPTMQEAFIILTCAFTRPIDLMIATGEENERARH
jgi:hypothetical protein